MSFGICNNKMSTNFQYPPLPELQVKHKKMYNENIEQCAYAISLTWSDL
jgi:hypothetical protein